LATWAFGNANRFDLVALPRLAGVALDRSYVDPASIDRPSPEPASSPPRPDGARGRLPRSIRPAMAVAALALALALAVAAGLARRAMVAARGVGIGAGPAGLASPADVGPPVGPEARARIVAGLADLAGRFEAFEVGDASDPAALMARISGRLRYRGPTLSAADLARLAAESDPDRDRALAWHERLRTFADDLPLPPDFAASPLPRQLDALARSFHVAPPARPDAVPAALAEALSRDGPVRPTPLAARYPALSDYARFLGRLPRGKNGR